MHGRPLLEIIYSLTEKKGVVPLPQGIFQTLIIKVF
jgi:hypothetical protein